MGNVSQFAFDRHVELLNSQQSCLFCAWHSGWACTACSCIFLLVAINSHFLNEMPTSLEKTDKCFLIDTLSMSLLHFLMERGSFQGCSTRVLCLRIVCGCVRHLWSPWMWVPAVALWRELLWARADGRVLQQQWLHPDLIPCPDAVT